MIALDTNVLVRHLYQRDDPGQSRAASRVVAGATAAGETVFISAVVLAETALVLRRIYRLPRGGFAQAVETLWNDRPSPSSTGAWCARPSISSSAVGPTSTTI